MRLSHLTPALDTCIALEDAGFPQNTVFVWCSRAQTAHVTLRSTHNGAGRDGGSGAPTLDEVLAELPAHLDFALPHPIYGATERTHALKISLGNRAVIGYHRVGVHDVQHRLEHENAVEVAARLYLALRAAGRLDPASQSEMTSVPSVSEAVERLAHAA